MSHERKPARPAPVAYQKGNDERALKPPARGNSGSQGSPSSFRSELTKQNRHRPT